MNTIQKLIGSLPQTLRASWNLLKQHRLFSGIYVVGTAISIAMTMLLFVVFYIKFGPVYPEVNRDRTLVIKGSKRYSDGNEGSWTCCGGISHNFIKEKIVGLDHVEAVGYRMIDWDEPRISVMDVEASATNNSNKERDKGRKVIGMYTNADFWRVFSFRFLYGRPYDKVECESKADVAVISNSLAKELFGKTDVVGKDVKIIDRTLKIVGVVDGSSAAMADSYSEIWYTYDQNALKSSSAGRNHFFLGTSQAYILCDKAENRESVQEAVQEVARRLSLEDQEYEYDLIGQPDTFLKSTFRTSSSEEPDYIATIRYFLWILFAILIIPAINLSGMISSRMQGRRDEVFVRRSYGARAWEIVNQVLTENLLLTAIGAVIGTLLSFVIVWTASDWLLYIFESSRPYIMSDDAIPTITPRMLFNPTVLFSAVGICLLLNVLSALLPALIAIRNSSPKAQSFSTGKKWIPSFIFVELLVVAAFVFIALDPLYTIIADRTMPLNYDRKGLLFVNFQPYGSAVKDENSNSEEMKATMKRTFLNLKNQLKDLPEIEDVCLVSNASIISGQVWQGVRLFADSTEMKTDSLVLQKFESIQMDDNNDLLRLYKMTNALTGKPFVTPNDACGKIIITENVARRFFGKKEVLGKHINKREICGVVKDFKFYDCEQPYPTVILINSDVADYGVNLARCYNFIVRVKENVNIEDFKRTFEKRYKDRFESQFFRSSEIQSIESKAQLQNDSNGQTNKMRLQTMLTLFAVLCIFLGMLGTFWIRCTDRRGEIGVRRSMGATQVDILKMFLGEAWRLVTLAWLITLPFLWYYADRQGLFCVSVRQVMNDVQDTSLPQNIFWQHFLIVALLAYLTLLATALIGTFIPALRASKTNPAEALKDE